MGPLTVTERGVFGAGRVKCDVGMFGWASRGGRMAQPVWEDSGGQMSQSSNSWGRDAHLKRSAALLSLDRATLRSSATPPPLGRLDYLLAGVVASFAPMIFLLFYQAESWFMVGLVGALFWTLLDLLMPGFFRFTLRGRFRQVLKTRFGSER